ncbi:MAG: pyrrolo-quinoline quinone [Bryobacteraceae bacterium]
MIQIRSLVAIAVSAACAIGYGQQTSTAVLTYHNNALRTGLTAAETKLTWTNVSPSTFAKLFSYPVDGSVYAQPLYVPAVNIGGQKRNVLYVVTENNSVYAFDADRPALGMLWQTNFNNGPSGTVVTPVPADDVSCDDISPQIGITSTPVIDPATATLYAVAKTKEVSTSGTSYFYRLHAINLSTGQERLGSPVDVEGTVPGTCGKTDGQGNVVFQAKIHLQRAALLLANGVVYVTFASHCDLDYYNGWMMGYDTQTLQQVSVFNTTPDASDGYCRGGIWQSGGGPAWDGANIYMITGNGDPVAKTPGTRGYGSSFLKLTPDPVTKALTVTDFFTPYYYQTLNSYDYDIGSSGPLVVPSPNGTGPNIVIGAGKNTTVYVLDRDNLGGLGTSSDNVVQELHNAVGYYGRATTSPVIFRNNVYFAGWSDRVKMFYVSNGRLSQQPIAKGGKGFLGLTAGLSLSADPLGNNPILWAISSGANGILHAFQGQTLAEIYNSDMAGTRDTLGEGVKFTPPTIANGKVYVPTSSSIVVYGLPPAN